ncbi:MAG: O-methyltransferase [Panacagrimonas sp.]
MLPITYLKKGPGWLSRELPEAEFQPPDIPAIDLIESRAAATNKVGRQPLWAEYQNVRGYKPGAGHSRWPDQVRTHRAEGLFYAWLAARRQSPWVVEFGTAFGVSGMFWLAGLSASGGTLCTFEPNLAWAEIARENLAAIASNFILTVGTFEAHALDVLAGKQVDICFVDAIHTSEFVTRQYDIARQYMAPGGLVVFDDIRFSDDMLSCWTSIARAAGVVSSVEIGRRVGMVELP